MSVKFHCPQCAAELQVREQCQELVLEPLEEGAVAEYLAARLPGSQLPVGLARVIHQRTEGNPLFMTDMLTFLADRQIVLEDQGLWRLKLAVIAAIGRDGMNVAALRRPCDVGDRFSVRRPRRHKFAIVA